MARIHTKRNQRNDSWQLIVFNWFHELSKNVFGKKLINVSNLAWRQLYNLFWTNHVVFLFQECRNSFLAKHKSGQFFNTWRIYFLQEDKFPSFFLVRKKFHSSTHYEYIWRKPFQFFFPKYTKWQDWHKSFLSSVNCIKHAAYKKNWKGLNLHSLQRCIVASIQSVNNIFGKWLIHF